MIHATMLWAAVLFAQSAATADAPCQPDPVKRKTYERALLHPTSRANDQEQRAYEISTGVRCIDISVKDLTRQLGERDKDLLAKSGDLLSASRDIAAEVAATHRAVNELTDAHRKAHQSSELPEPPPTRGPLPASTVEITVNHGTEPAAEAGKTEGAEDKNTRRQLDPRVPIWQYYATDTTAQFAILLVPDPRIPRHRRAYDNTIVAVTQGMLRSNFVLDGYEFPWQGSLSGAQPETESAKKVFEDADYGLMLFRRDGWREANSPVTRYVRALYVVPEAVTYGVQTQAFVAGVDKIREQCPEKQPPAPTSRCIDSRPIKVFGPSFSGSLDSLLRISSTIKDESFELLASGTTSATNADIETRSENRLVYRTGAVDDVRKLDALRGLVKQLRVDPEAVAFFREATVFGRYLCPDHVAVETADVMNFCKRTKWIYFPVNIADIRHGVREKQAKVREHPPIELPVLEQRLSLQDGAENGSELPESHQSPLTAVSNQLDLEAVLNELRATNPRVVVVIATDVRDRLFLFEEIRRKVPNALLVDFETDRLLAHPDFIHASRGALTIASSSLLQNVAGTSLLAAPTDTHMILLQMIRLWSTADSPTTHLHTVTRTGLLERAEPTSTLKGYDALRSGAAEYVDSLPFIGMVLGLCIVWALVPRRSAAASPWLPLGDCLYVVLTIVTVLVIGLLSGKMWLELFNLAVALLAAMSVRQIARREKQREDPPTVRSTRLQRVVRWTPRVLLILVLAALLIGEALRTIIADGIAEFAPELNGSWRRGLSYSEVVKTSVAGMLLAFWYAHAYSHVTIANTARVGTLLSGSAALRVAQCYRRETCFWFAPGVLLGSFVVWAGWQIGTGDLRLTVWGPTAGAVAFGALAAVTLVTFALFCGSLRVVQRIRAWAYAADEKFTRPSGRHTRDEWHKERLWGLPRVAPTPIAATVFSCSCDSVHDPADATGDTHLRFSEILAHEMTLYRWAAIGVGISTVAAAWMAYLYPITNADELLLVNLCMLIPTGLLFAYNTVRFERDRVLSRLLCDRDQRTEFSMPLFGYVALPFVILAIVIGITQVPGVLDWGSGIISLLKETIKPGG